MMLSDHLPRETRTVQHKMLQHLIEIIFVKERNTNISKYFKYLHSTLMSVYMFSDIDVY